jgi:cation diffusion facilitator CzcD-associated flavoprotein CzcO
MRIDRGVGGWRIETEADPITASSVVIATGKYRTPTIPDWPGKDDFGGGLTHSSSYRNAGPYRGKKVLVVGPGASGFEIATQIAHGGAAEVWLSIRTPPHIVHRNVGPFPSDLFAVLGRHLPTGLVDRAAERVRRMTLGDLSEYGLVPPRDGIYTRVKRTGMIPTVDGPYLDAVKRGMVQVVAAVEAFGGDAVELADGSRVDPDCVIAATGYERGLEPLVGHLGVLTRDGHPSAHGPDTYPDAPNLYFTGFTEPFSGNLRELRLDARKIARAIARRDG